MNIFLGKIEIEKSRLEHAFLGTSKKMGLRDVWNSGFAHSDISIKKCNSFEVSAKVETCLRISQIDQEHYSEHSGGVNTF